MIFFDFIDEKVYPLLVYILNKLSRAEPNPEGFSLTGALFNLTET